MRKREGRWPLAWILILVIFAGGTAGSRAAGKGVPGDRAATGAPDAASVRELFQRFRGLEGTWRGRSTAGWTDRAEFRVIAAGSVVVETSEFEAHPDETMMTMVHLDGDGMVLTHYCVAKNQPRLQATSIEEGGMKAIFTFRDGTNLASRDQGHMDRVMFQFQDENHFSSQWSFSKDGREAWMEEIHYERLR